MHAPQLRQPTGAARYHNTVNHTVANDMAALSACVEELTQMGIAVLATQTGGARPRVVVPNCMAARNKLRGAHVGQGNDQDGPFHRFVATVCLCDVEWRVPA